jgi:hypothetical protein
MKLKVVKSHLATKKYDAIFTYEDGKTKTVPFGAAGYSDYTIHRDVDRRNRYILRHSRSENFDDFMSRGSLSMHLLWGPSTSLRENIKTFKKRFNLK